MNNIEFGNALNEALIEGSPVPDVQFSPVDIPGNIQAVVFEEFHSGDYDEVAYPSEPIEIVQPSTAELHLESEHASDKYIKNGRFAQLTAESYKEDFTEVYPLLQPKLINYLIKNFRLLPEDAEQLAQDIHIRALGKLNLYSVEKGSFSNWFFTMAYNMGVDQLRRDYRRPRGDYNHTSPQDLLINVASKEKSVEEDVLSGLEAMRVRRALTILGETAPEQRQAIEMAYLQGKTHSQIAKELGEPIGTIKTRIRLGINKLRDLTKEEGYP
jgi:RNA polymerase sigma factor (sigma-70 family)